MLLQNGKGGIFMFKHIKRLCFLAVLVMAVFLGGLLADSNQLREDLLRLHVVGASVSEEDQAVKLEVRDAILATLEQGMSDVADMEQAKAYVRDMIPKLTEVANQVLEKAGFDKTVSISLGEEEFPVREYDTFSLPSGIYQSLRIIIGEGEGQNWWCVVFPKLCMSATTEEFVEVAAMEGMDETLSGTLTGEYEIRFWLLDQLGKLGNFLHGDSE